MFLLRHTIAGGTVWVFATLRACSYRCAHAPGWKIAFRHTSHT